MPFGAAVVVNRTLGSETFQSIVSRITGYHLLFIGDECHHHGAENLAKSLPMHARMRLGLSATPKHYFDDERTSRIHDY